MANHVVKFVLLKIMLKELFIKIKNYIFKDLTKEESKKFSILSAAFFFIIGLYWIVRPLKNAILKDTVGVLSIPLAKQFSIVLVIGLLFSYSMLLDRVSKVRLFYVISLFYSISFALLSYCIAFPNVICKSFIGFISYALIESFGSMFVVMFWGFVSNNVNLCSAKRGYFLIFTMGQLGGIFGTTLVTRAEYFGIPVLMAIASCSILLIPFFINKFSKGRTINNASYSEKKKIKPGILSGIKLFFSKPYLLSIFTVLMMYEFVMTIFDFKMQLLADKQYSTAAYAAFNAFYGQLSTLIACIFAFLGSSFFMRKFGLKLCLLFFPMTVGTVVVLFYFFPSLWLAFASMVFIKGISYGFGNPVKEVLYIPTSESIRFKAKSWVDMFGNRSSKAGGATINRFLTQIPEGLANYGALISFMFIGIWFVAALYLGHVFDKLAREKKIIE